MKRVIEEELLDRDQGTPEEIASSLKSLRHVNRWFGGNRTHTLLLLRVAGKMQCAEMHVLEVASGRADVLQAAAKALMRRGVALRMTLLDNSSQHLPSEDDWDRELPSPERIEGDALRIPVADGSVDVVSCCLFLHHLDEQQAALFLREALRVARIAVIVNDLERTRLHYVLARLHALTDASRISRHDGPVSVRRSYTYEELEGLLANSGCRLELRRRFLFRLGALIWKR
jgi:ubiquinone/menaquinone biosynthesis C-methylase UbiE